MTSSVLHTYMYVVLSLVTTHIRVIHWVAIYNLLLHPEQKTESVQRKKREYENLGNQAIPNGATGSPQNSRVEWCLPKDGRDFVAFFIPYNRLFMRA